MDDIKTMDPETLKIAYEFGSELYWAARTHDEDMPASLMDRLIAIADALLGVTK